MLTKLTIESIPENEDDKSFAIKAELTTGEVTIDKVILQFCLLLLAYGFSDKLVKDYINYEELM
jgi:hypothetical protein